jgi:hypothetical protein
LELIPDRFEGQANFSVGGYSGHPRTSTENLSIPLDVVHEFLRTLVKTPLEKGEYVPLFEHTDDYPEVKIEVALKEIPIVFLSSSQGEGNAPWKVTIGKDEYISRSTIPADALKLLMPYLKNDVLETLIQQVR